MLWKGDDLYIFDHDLAFSFVVPTIGWQPPWTGQGLEFLRDHIFYDSLKGAELNWDRLMGAIEAITDARLKEFAAAVPLEWKQGSDTVSTIVKYLEETRRNRDALFSAIKRILE